jgi:NAD(P)-dependent dehydrogenase (short-subunit alcohol dehydrogenase family)
MTMQIENSVAFVTGANRGLGLALVQALLAKGARKVYAGVRDPASITIPGVVAVRLDVTDPAQVAAAAAACGDVDLVINNAGIAHMGDYMDADAVAKGRAMFDTNVFGVVSVSQAFTPVLAANGGGALVNILSVASWVNAAPLSLYAASKSAAWGFTNGLRTSLAAQGTLVTGVHVGFMDTDMTDGIDFPKTSPLAVADRILAGIEAGAPEIVADDISATVQRGLSQGIYLTPLER